jgi:hypothetical protein
MPRAADPDTVVYATRLIVQLRKIRRVSPVTMGQLVYELRSAGSISAETQNGSARLDERNPLSLRSKSNRAWLGEMLGSPA